MRATSSVSERGDTETEKHSVLILKIGSLCKIENIKEKILIDI